MEALIAAVVSAVTFGLSRTSKLLDSKVTKSGPCANANGASTQFILNDAGGACYGPEQQYEMVYFGPEGNPTVDVNEQIIDANSLVYEPTITGIQYTYQIYRPDSAVIQTQRVSNVNCYVNANFTRPLNMCPQLLQLDLKSPVTSATATCLPINSQSPKAYITCGLPNGSQSSENWPAVAYTSQPVPGQESNGLATVLYIDVVQTCTLYIELGGARGGDVEVYSSGIDPISGTAKPLDPSYVGGKPGVVFGKLTVQAGEVLKVFLGSQGTSALDNIGTLAYNGNGQGGLGTIYGGANGAGCSYIIKYGPTGTKNALSLAYESGLTYSLVAVAGGGGGASRNASGGSAGLSADSMLYGATQDSTNAFGSAGGKSFILGSAPLVPGRSANDLSGGGGVTSAGGASLVTFQEPPRASEGTLLKPFLGQLSPQPQGGGSVNTVVGSGGGGGGGGLCGGGAGGFNGYPKPNNVHGAGGGGSSFQGLLQSATTGQAVCLNAYRVPQPPVWDSVACNRHGYLVIGIAL